MSAASSPSLRVMRKAEIMDAASRGERAGQVVDAYYTRSLDRSHQSTLPEQRMAAAIDAVSRGCNAATGPVDCRPMELIVGRRLVEVDVG